VIDSLSRRGLILRKQISSDPLDTFLDFIQPKQPKDQLIRIGSAFDGGYLVPESLVTSVKTLFSGGVADDVAAEAQFLDYSPHNACHLIDGSIEKLPKDLGSRAFFTRDYLGINSGLPGGIHFSDWLTRAQISSTNNFLSLDIEGGEWLLFKQSPVEVWNHFDLIVLELHGLDSLLDPCFFNENIPFLIRALREFKVVHLHINNSSTTRRGKRGITVASTIELTLVHNRTGCATAQVALLPHELDRPNLPHHRDLDPNLFFRLKDRRPEKLGHP
jgi:hypothetical protein